MTPSQKIEIPTGYLSNNAWERIIKDNSGLRSCSSVYTTGFLRNFEIINAGWLDEDENSFNTRNYIARRMRKDGWTVEVSRGWDPGKGTFYCLEAVRPRDYCRDRDPEYQLPEALRDDEDGI